jgi:hypothetical protein
MASVHLGHPNNVHKILQSQNTGNIRSIGYGRRLSFKVTLRVERNEFRCTIENYQSDRSAITIGN